MAYSGVYVFGDSLVDAGNALKLAQWYGDLTFSDLPDGAPAAADGYYQGRFSDGLTFADLLTNTIVGTPTKPVFPYGFEDPWFGFPISPFAGDPSGNNLNFAYGGAQVRQGDEVVQDLDAQTDTFRDAVDEEAPGSALYIITMGGNDVRSMAKAGSNPMPLESALEELGWVADRMISELGGLIFDGARHFLITGVPDVGLIPAYDLDGSNDLNATEQMRADAATLYSQYLDHLIRTEVVPALEARGATVTYVPMMDYQDGAATVTGGLNAILPTLEALHGLEAGALTTDLLEHRSLVFFDDVHPTAQVHALFGSYAQALLTDSPWVETLPLTGADVDYSLAASISVAGEVDKLVIATVAGTEYRFDMLGISSLGTPGSLADPALKLLGPGGNLVGSNADDGAGFDSVLTFTVAASGNHTLELSATGNLTGSYAFQASVVGGAAMQAGNSYTVGSSATLVIEGAGGIGTDTVLASTHYVLAAGSEIEALTTTNAKAKTAINLTGNDFAQAITGNAGANVLEGKGGADTLTGGGGKDVFVLSGAVGGSNVDAITDYGRGEVVDISKVLSVAAGTNVVSGGFLRVTSSGLIQVDLTGGGNDWVTLSSINGNSAVTLRYLSGGSATNVAVSRVAASSVMTAAAAAAGLMAAPAVAEEPGVSVESYAMQASALAIALTARELIDGAGRGGDALDLAASEMVEPAFHATNHLSSLQGRTGNAFARVEAMPDPPAALPAGTDSPVAPAAVIVAHTVAMPSAEMLKAIIVNGVEGPAAESGDLAKAEVGRILAEVIDAGGAIESLFAGLPGNGLATGAVVAPGAQDVVMSFAFGLPALDMDAAVAHPDAAACV